MKKKLYIILSLVFMLVMARCIYFKGYESQNDLPKEVKSIMSDYDENALALMKKNGLRINTPYGDNYISRITESGDSLISDKYNWIPIIEFLNEEIVMVVANNSTFEDGMFWYMFPIDVNHIDIYRKEDLKLVERFTINKYVDVLCWYQDNIYMKFMDSTYGKISFEIPN